MLALIRQIPYRIFILLALTLWTTGAFAQTDSLRAVRDTTKDFTPVDSLQQKATPFSDSAKVQKVLREHSPRKAALRSLVLPGWGQVYNKKYWKVPIVYGALGVSGAVFNYNLQWYRRTRFAYKTLVNGDTQNFGKVHPMLKVFIDANDAGALQSYRNEFRRNIDFSALVFILLWGLNVVDATVDAHLKTFDVSPDLSFRMKLGHSEMAGTTGLSFVVALK